MTFKICAHNVECNISGYSDDLEILEESWEEQIKNFICEGYTSGQFAIIEGQNNEEFLNWSIV